MITRGTLIFGHLQILLFGYPHKRSLCLQMSGSILWKPPNPHFFLNGTLELIMGMTRMVNWGDRGTFDVFFFFLNDHGAMGKHFLETAGHSMETMEMMEMMEMCWDDFP